jgi:hypothetical protein
MGTTWLYMDHTQLGKYLYVPFMTPNLPNETVSKYRSRGRLAGRPKHCDMEAKVTRPHYSKNCSAQTRLGEGGLVGTQAVSA